jgi:proton-dependent oligopeptide transporter, POT family
MSGAALEVEEAARGDLGGLHRSSVGGDKTGPDVNLDAEIDKTDAVLVGPNGEQYPTKEELQTLRRVHGTTSWVLYTIGSVHKLFSLVGSNTRQFR